MYFQSVREESGGRGFFTEKGRASDWPPPGAGFDTVMLAVPEEPISEAGIEAVSCVELTTLVDREPPFQSMEAPETKLLPVTVRVKEPDPAVAEEGLMELMEGTGLL